MIDVEKGDVDISKLFEFKTEISLIGVNGKEAAKAYIRLPSDAEVNRARVKSIRHSGELRKNLSNLEWEDREYFIPDISGLSRDELITLICNMSIQEIGMEVASDMVIPMPKEPAGDASLEEQEQYQNRVDEYPILVRDKMKIEMARKMDRLKKVLEDKNDKELNKLYEEELIKEHCNTAFKNIYKLYCVYFGTYADSEHKTLLFDSFDKLKESPEFLVQQLQNAYESLELESELLKKSLVATQ